MSDTVTDQISFFRSQITNKRFDDESLRILESVLVSKDVKSLIQVKSSLKEFLRPQSLDIIREISEKSVEHKLSILQFFVHAFALTGDVESCLALRYEALVLRELKGTQVNGLQVSYREWLTFAEHSLDNGFYAIARKACEKALLSFRMNDTVDVLVVDKIKRLMDVAVAAGSSGSVQAEAAEYLKQKTIEQSSDHPLYIQTRLSASTLFRNGIKKHPIRKLNELRRLQQVTCSPQSIED